MTATPTAKTMVDLLRRHHIKPGEELPGGVFLTEVAAPHANRRADALYMGFTGSRGHHIHVFEVKVTRPDWLTELNNPAKAEAWWRHCHYFWIVAPRGIVKLGELPEGWGLMHPGKSRVRMEVEVKPVLHEPELTMGLVLELAKKLDLHRVDAVREARARGAQEFHDQMDRRMETERTLEVQHQERMDERASETLRKLSDLTGLHFAGADGPQRNKLWATLEESAEALQAYCSGHVRRAKLLRDMHAELAQLYTRLSKLLGELPVPELPSKP